MRIIAIPMAERRSFRCIEEKTSGVGSSAPYCEIWKFLRRNMFTAFGACDGA